MCGKRQNVTGQYNWFSPRRYRSCSQNWNGVNEEEFRKGSKINYSEIQLMEGKKKILGCQTKKFKNDQNKLYYKSFPISDRLRKRPYLPLLEARKLRKNNNDIDFYFAEINCYLEFRYKNASFRYFNSQNELPNLINK